MRHLLRIPEDFEIEPEAEDEFECLNLDITRPPLSGTNGPLPVLVWIYGTMADLQGNQDKASLVLTAVP